MLRSTHQALRLRFTGIAQAALLAALCGLCALAAAQAPPSATQGIYTCSDAKGRKLTSDRPIAECSDREQKLLNPSGTLKARVGPTLTAQERAELEAKEKTEQEERARLNEERRRDRALLVRYPSQAMHDKERAEALGQIGVVRLAAMRRVEELLRQRTAVSAEMEFYKKEPGKAPPALRRQVDEVAHSLAIQGRFIADQDAELKRVNARFEEELGRLQQLWAMTTPPTPTTPATLSKKR